MTDNNTTVQVTDDNIIDNNNQVTINDALEKLLNRFLKEIPSSSKFYRQRANFF